MSIFKIAQTSFTRGELTNKLLERYALDHYQLGLAYARNYQCMRHGCIVRRPPTKFIYEVKDSADETSIYPFTFGTEQAYILEFGDLYMRVYKDDGIVLDTGVPVEIVTPFTAAEAKEIDITQSNDVLYIAHKSHHPYRLTRTSHTTWSLDLVQFTDGPYGAKNSSGTKATPAGTLVANAINTVTFDRIDGINDGDGFSSDDIGRYFRYEHAGKNSDLGYTAPTTGQHVAWGQIDSINSTTSIEVLWLGTAGIETVSGIDLVNNVTETEHWWLGEFYKADTYPHKVQFYDDRLCWARSNTRAGTTWKSNTGGYENYSPSDRDGAVADDHAMTSTISAGEISEIQWLVEGSALQVGTKSAVRTFQGFDGGSLAPDDRRQVRQSTYGCADVTPVQVGNATLYIEYGGYAMREMVYSLQDDGYITPDTSILSDHLVTTPIIDLAYCQSPHSIVWGLTSGGDLLSLTYERDQRTVGWMKHDLDCDVESIATIQGENYNELWMVTKKTIDGATKRYVQKFKNVFNSILHDLEDYAHLDFQVSYDGSAVSTVTGIDHLEGETVGVHADGIYIGDATVASGQITLPLSRTASKITVGLKYTSTTTSLPPHIQGRNGSTLAAKKKVQQVAVSAMDAVDVEVKSAHLADSEYKRIWGSDFTDDKETKPDLIDDIKSVAIKGSWRGRGQVSTRVTSTYPAIIRGWEGDYVIEP